MIRRLYDLPVLAPTHQCTHLLFAFVALPPLATLRNPSLVMDNCTLASIPSSELFATYVLPPPSPILSIKSCSVEVGSSANCPSSKCALKKALIQQRVVHWFAFQNYHLSALASWYLSGS
eukprot:TRINITY_DN10403_c0_g1_i1.p1 TRINITY_DN10403_c0_g1~~TRINITY_DN10403_c0_g1_i1.p1  ORF type:complete len:120 (+),score=0.75 TRINITY_DN10403_c0_g1_i1:100-459(+)